MELVDFEPKIFELFFSAVVVGRTKPLLRSFGGSIVLEIIFWSELFRSNVLFNSVVDCVVEEALDKMGEYVLFRIALISLSVTLFELDDSQLLEQSLIGSKL